MVLRGRWRMSDQNRRARQVIVSMTSQVMLAAGAAVGRRGVPQRAGADHQLGGDLLARDVLAGERGLQRVDREPAERPEVLPDRGQRRRVVRGADLVVEPHDRHVVGHPHALLPERVQEAERQLVVGSEDRRRQSLAHHAQPQLVAVGGVPARPRRAPGRPAPRPHASPRAGPGRRTSPAGRRRAPPRRSPGRAGAGWPAGRRAAGPPRRRAGAGRAGRRRPTR